MRFTSISWLAYDLEIKYSKNSRVFEHPGVSVGERSICEEPEAEAAVAQQWSAANGATRLGHEDHRHGVLQESCKTQYDSLSHFQN